LKRGKGEKGTWNDRVGCERTGKGRTGNEEGWEGTTEKEGKNGERGSGVKPKKTAVGL